METLSRPGWVPDWIDQVGTALWICDPGQRLAFANEQALELLETTAGEAVGRRCYQVIAGRDTSGFRFCEARCPLLRLAEKGSELEPFLVRVARGRGPTRCALVMCLPLQAPDGSYPWLAHIASDVTRARRIEEYTHRVASRSAGGRGEWESKALAELTPRELEVLESLADDKDVHQTARELHVSYATARNHVQHILAKLEVHSTQEAVALFLVRDGNPQDA